MCIDPICGPHANRISLFHILNLIAFASLVEIQTSCSHLGGLSVDLKLILKIPSLHLQCKMCAESISKEGWTVQFLSVWPQPSFLPSPSSPPSTLHLLSPWHNHNPQHENKQSQCQDFTQPHWHTISAQMWFCFFPDLFDCVGVHIYNEFTSKPTLP